MSESPRRRVAVVGATGVAGQQFLVSLDRHPWFEVTALAASTRSAGKPYRAAITNDRGHLQWGCEEPLPAAFSERLVVDASHLELDGIDLVFSAVESASARALEERMAPQVPVISTSSTSWTISSLHPGGGGEGSARDPQDSGCAGRGSRPPTRAPALCDLDPGQCARRTHRGGVRKPGPQGEP